MRRRIIAVVVCVLLIAVLAPILWYYYVYVPDVFGRQYVSVSFRPMFYSRDEYSGNIDVFWGNRTIRTGWACIEITVTNRYSVPVRFRYNGFDVVWLIYNQTVSDPSDVVSSRHFLVWGAYHHLTSTSRAEAERGVYDFTGEDFQYYADRRGLLNYTIAINAGTPYANYRVFSPFDYHGRWWGQYWFNHSSRVPPGNYFMYAIILGIASGPQNVTIVSYVV